MHEILASLNKVIVSLENDGLFVQAETLEQDAFLRIAEEMEAAEVTEEEKMREKSNAIHPGEPKNKKS